MATFFGEVREIPSRAGWWSDTEDDPEDEESGVGQSLAQTFAVQGDARAELSKCSRLFVSMVKKQPASANRLVTITSDRFKGDVSVLYKNAQGDMILVFNDTFIKSNRPIALAKFVHQNLLSSINWSVCHLVLISKDFTSRTGVTFFSNDNTPQPPVIVELAKVLESRGLPVLPLLPPLTLNNVMELELIELAILHKIPFLCLLLPSLDSEAGTGWIPQEVINYVNEFHDLSYSNLIT